MGYDWVAWGHRLQRLRKRRGLTQRELADALGVRRNSVNRLENALAVPSVRLLEQLADVLGSTLPTLLTIPRRRTKR
jgi:transcriptional regulator with XRE-family HTH domain